MPSVSAGFAHLSLVKIVEKSVFFFASYEMVFCLFIYSNVFQFILPKPPVDLTIVFLGLSVIYGSVIVLKNGLYVRGLIIVASLFPFLLWQLTSLSWTLSNRLAYDYLTLMFTVNLWCLISTSMIIASDRARTVRFLMIIIAMSVFVAVYGIAIYIEYGSFKFAPWEGGGGRVYNLWGRAAMNGAVALVLMFILARLFSFRQFVSALLLGACLLFILLSTSRSALFAFAIPVLFLFIVYFPTTQKRSVSFYKPMLILMLVGTACIAVIVYIISTGGSVATVNRLLKLLAQSENTAVVMGPNRFSYYSAAVDYWFTQPIFGHGVRSFSLLFKAQEDLGAQPHNIILEILAETGVIGILLFSFFVYTAVKSISLNRLREDPLLLCVLMLFISRLTASMFGVDLSGQYPFFIMIGLLALRPKASTSAGDARRNVSLPKSLTQRRRAWIPKLRANNFW